MTTKTEALRIVTHWTKVGTGSSYTFGITEVTPAVAALISKLNGRRTNRNVWVVETVDEFVRARTARAPHLADFVASTASFYRRNAKTPAEALELLHSLSTGATK